MRMWDHMRRARPGPALQAAFASLPAARMTPRAAYEELVAGRVELVPLAEMAGRTVAVGLQPYPPGIPILVPGEDAGPADGPFLAYLRLLTEWDAAFPGFEHEVEGAIREHPGGQYSAYCVSDTFGPSSDTPSGGTGGRPPGDYCVSDTG